MGIGPTINADDLHQYARRKEAENDVADLVRKLVSSSVSATASSVRFRSGQGIRSGGYDGIVQTPSGGFQVPQGDSVWEISARLDCDAKANQDYSERKADPIGQDTKKTTYVAVNMSRWPNKEEWANTKKKEGFWGDVIALDAGDLATWLEEAPAVAAWFRRQSGLQPAGTSDIEGFLESWQEGTDPPLNPEFLTLERDDAVKDLHLWMAGAASSIAVRGDSTEEIVAFLCAAVMQLEERTRDHFLSKTVIVREATAFEQIVKQRGPSLVLIPYFHGFNGSLEAPKKGHHLLIPKDPEIPPSGAEILLSAQSEEAVSGLLQKIGINESRAAQLANRSRGRISVLRRFLGYSQVPAWASAKHARELIPFLLIGSWQPAMKGDSEIVEKHFGIKSSELEAKLLEWKNTPDAPVQQRGYVWEWRSRYESWKLLSGSISDQDLKLFLEIAKEVLGEKDPTLQLPADQRWTAGIKGISRKYSDAMLKGISETLALLSNSNDQIHAVRLGRPENFSSNIVHTVLDPSWMTWISLKAILPNLAEASPNTFLSRLEDSIRAGNEGVAHIFLEKRDAFFGGIPQAGILWALETLAWDPLLLGRVTLTLARLQEFDCAENNIGNRPIRSLREILCPWHPQTFVPVQERAKVLRNVAKQVPEVGWQIAKAFIPRSGEIATQTHSPTWREPLLSMPRPKATMADLAFFVSEISKLLLEMANDNPGRFAELIEMIERFPQDSQKELLAKIKAHVGLQDQNTREKVREELRDFLHRTRAYPDAEWTSKNSEIIETAEEIFRSLAPTDIIDRHAWLFAAWPKLTEPEPRDYDERNKLISDRRTASLDEILKAGVGTVGILRLAESVEHSHVVGDLLASSSIEEKAEIENDLLAMNPVLTPKLRSFLGAWLFRRHQMLGRSWVVPYLQNLREKKNHDAVVLALTTLPCERETWELAEKQGADVYKDYWKSTQVFFLEGPWKDIRKAVEELLAVERVSDVARILADYVSEKNGKEQPPTSEVLQLIQQLADRLTTLEEPIQDPTMLGHYLGEVYKKLETNQAVNQDELATIEWRLLPIFEHSPVSTKNLFRLLEKSPETFADLVGFIYKQEKAEHAEAEEPETPLPDELIGLRASRAYSLIGENWKGFPGVDSTGKIQEEKFLEWIKRARQKLQESRRTAIGESEIGKILARSPMGSDGIWPAELVRKLIEDSDCEELSRGFHIAVLNNRGPTTRDPHDGGKQERELVQRYQGWSAALAAEYPKTSALLQNIAESYKDDARREDLHAERFD